MRRLDGRELRELGTLGLLTGEPVLGMIAGALLFAMFVIVGGLPMLFG